MFDGGGELGLMLMKGNLERIFFAGLTGQVGPTSIFFYRYRKAKSELKDKYRS